MSANESFHAHGKHHQPAGVSAGVISAFAYGVMSLVVHRYAGKLPSTEIVFARSIFAIVLLLPFALRDRHRLFTRAANIFWTRSCMGAISILCFTWDLQHTSIGLANVLFNIATLIVIVMAWSTHYEALNWKKIACLLAVTAGGMVFWSDRVTGGGRTVLAVGLFGAFAAAASYTSLKRASASWSAMTLTWGISVTSIPVALLMKRGAWTPPSHGAFLPLLSIALLCIVGQLTVALSYRWAEISTATALAAGSMAVGVGLDVLMGSPSGARQLLGCAIYLAGCVPLTLLKAHPREDAKTPLSTTLAPFPEGELRANEP